MSLTWAFTGGAPEPHNELAGQTMIILYPRGDSEPHFPVGIQMHPVPIRWPLTRPDGKPGARAYASATHPIASPQVAR
jgi:hypothetical protein